MKNLADMFARRFKSSDPLPPAKPFTHSILVDTGSSYAECGVLSKGTFFVMSGPTGVGKSSLLAMFAAATWKGKHGNIVCPESRKRTLWIDTEMPRTDFLYFQRGVVLRMMELDTEEDALWALNLTYLETIEEKRNGVYDLFTALGNGGTIPDGKGGYYDLSEVGLVVLDGIVDIIPNTTDETFAKEHIEKYKHFVEKSNVPHITVLHSDKKANDLRGTFGTFLGQKASGTAMIKSPGPGEPATVRAHKGVRGTRPFGPFDIIWGEDGMPRVDIYEYSVDELLDSFGKSTEDEAKGQTPMGYGGI